MKKYEKEEYSVATEGSGTVSSIHPQKSKESSGRQFLSRNKYVGSLSVMNLQSPDLLLGPIEKCAAKVRLVFVRLAEQIMRKTTRSPSFFLPLIFLVTAAIAPGIGGGFFYLTCSGEVLALPSPTGFEERYVLLDDAPFFEVSGPLGAQGKECAARLRGVFRARAGVLRVAYAASVRPRSVEAMAQQVREMAPARTYL